jgi:non-ribosomal peptide synthase protein (TIGR01720 family)
MSVHHLAVDGYSSAILLQDLERAYLQLSRGEPVRLPPKTTSVRAWAQRLTEYAQSQELQQELDYWLALGNEPVSPLPLDFPEGVGTQGWGRSVVTALDEEDTRALVEDGPRRWGTGTTALLSTGLARGMAGWTGSASLLITLVSHGREPLFPGIDLSRTAGWLNTRFPVRLMIDEAAGPVGALRDVDEQLREVPHGGIGFDVLRTLTDSPAIAQQLRRLPHPDVTLNYAGRRDELSSSPSVFIPGQQVQPKTSHRPTTGNSRLQITASTLSGRMYLRFYYHENVYRRETIEWVAERVLESLRALAVESRPEPRGTSVEDTGPIAAQQIAR